MHRSNSDKPGDETGAWLGWPDIDEPPEMPTQAARHVATTASSNSAIADDDPQIGSVERDRQSVSPGELDRVAAWGRRLKGSTSDALSRDMASHMN
jgi:hypothetical protein